jgi:carbon monoxide dehydrogenase subunit G
MRADAATRAAPTEPPMEVKLDKRYPVSASPEQAWTVLRDIRATAACMPGAAITEQLDETHFKGTVKSKVGPAVMMFGGDIELLGVDESTKQLKMLGKGADKSGSSASMNLVAHLEPGADANSAVLVGQATILVSGKLAQFGSRLLVPVSDAMLGQFAANFNTAAAAVAAAVPAASAPAPTPAAAAPGAASPAPAPAPANELNALGLMWTVIKGWFAGLFGKKR